MRPKVTEHTLLPLVLSLQNLNGRKKVCQFLDILNIINLSFHLYSRFTITPALSVGYIQAMMSQRCKEKYISVSSKYSVVLSFCRYGFLCLTTTAGITKYMKKHKIIHLTVKHISPPPPPPPKIIRLSFLSPFFLSSGFPFFTVARTRPPAPAQAGSRFSHPLIPFTAMMQRFLAPVLSAQFITAPTGRPREIRNLAPDAPFFPVVFIYQFIQPLDCLKVNMHTQHYP